MGKQFFCKLCEDQGFVEVSLPPDDSYTRHCECNDPDSQWDIDQVEDHTLAEQELI